MSEDWKTEDTLEELEKKTQKTEEEEEAPELKWKDSVDTVSYTHLDVYKRQT